MNLKKQIEIVEAAIADLKGENVVILDVADKNVEMRALIVATGRSKKHVCGIAEALRLAAKKNRLPVFGIEGADFCEWVLVDLDEIVVHLMSAEMRNYYHLEKLWSDDLEK